MGSCACVLATLESAASIVGDRACVIPEEKRMLNRKLL